MCVCVKQGLGVGGQCKREGEKIGERLSDLLSMTALSRAYTYRGRESARVRVRERVCVCARVRACECVGEWASEWVSEWVSERENERGRERDGERWAHKHTQTHTNTNLALLGAQGPIYYRETYLLQTYWYDKRDLFTTHKPGVSEGSRGAGGQAQPNCRRRQIHPCVIYIHIYDIYVYDIYIYIYTYIYMTYI